MTALIDLLVDRLESAPLGGEEEGLLLAALLGDDALRDAMGGAAPPEQAATQASARATHQPAGAYLTSITVQGFRGIGPAVTLELQPGPGLTVVCGRNGSGKSSFAEALEVLLTGSIRRLEQRAAVWQDTWRCLHGGEPEVTATLVVEGSRGATTLTRRWAGDDKNVTDGSTRVLVAGEAAAGVERLGWGEALVLHRPFLSPSELDVLPGKPSDLYDQLNRLLGLEELAEVSKRLGDARRTQEQLGRAATGSLPAVRDQLGALAGDARAAEALGLLTARVADLDAVARLAAGHAPAVDPDLRALQGWRALTVPEREAVDAVASRLESAADALDEAAHTDASEAAATVRLLAAAADYVERYGHGDCPVCATPGAIGADWPAATAARIEQLRAQATAVTAAEAEVVEAVGEALEMVRAAPTALAAPPAARRGPGRWPGTCAPVTPPWPTPSGGSRKRPTPRSRTARTAGRPSPGPWRRGARRSGPPGTPAALPPR